MISKEAEVLRLYHAEKWRIGTIASQLGVHHTTVQRVFRHAGVETKAVAPRASIADPFVPFIVQQLEKYLGLCQSSVRDGQGARLRGRTRSLSSRRVAPSAALVC